MTQTNEKPESRSTRNWLWAAVVLVVLVFFGTIGWSWYVVASKVGSAPQATISPEALKERLAPIGKVNTGDAPVAVADAAPAEPRSGETIYQTVCQACHATGVSNAPKFGNAQDWEPRLAKGRDALLTSLHNGVAGTVMVAKGSCADCSDDELNAVLDHMLDSVKGGGASAPEAEAAPAAAPVPATEPAPAAEPEAAPAAEPAPAPAAH